MSSNTEKAVNGGAVKKLVIIPAYNEQGGIERTVRDIIEHAPDFD